MSLWSDSDWEDSDKEIPCRPKRQRVSGQLPNWQQTKLPVINQNQAASDQTKLAFCPDILKDILIKILLIDSLCGCFRSYGRFFSRGKHLFVEMFSGDQRAVLWAMDLENEGGKVMTLTKTSLKTMTSHRHLGFVQLCFRFSGCVWEICCGQGWCAHHSVGWTEIRHRDLLPTVFLVTKRWSTLQSETSFCTATCCCCCCTKQQRESFC